MQKFSDVYALILLESVLENYVPWSSSAMCPGAVVKILNEIIINGRRTVVEFGSGVSTLYVAKVMKEYGGKICSVDHDELWIEKLSQIASKEGVLANIEFVVAPMAKSELALDGNEWYDELRLFQLIKNYKFDMVIVDGPLAYKKDIMRSRFPALPFLHENSLLLSDHTVFMDDALRAGEAEIIRRYCGTYGYSFDVYKEHRVAIAHTKDCYTI